MLIKYKNILISLVIFFLFYCIACAKFKFGLTNVIKDTQQKLDKKYMATPIKDNEWRIVDSDLVRVGIGNGNYLEWPRLQTCPGTNNGMPIQWKTSDTSGQPTWDNTNKCYNYPEGESADDYPAFKWAENLVYKGYDDWRLPTKHELKELYDYGRTYIDYAPDYYWSSMEAAYYSVYCVWFNNGVVTGLNNKTTNCYIRAVREGP